jgi:cytochrome c-type biogenesis protein
MIVLGARWGDDEWPAWKIIVLPSSLAVIGAFVLYGAGIVAEQLLPSLGGQGHPLEQQVDPASASAASAAPLTLNDLYPLLVRAGSGPGGTAVEMTYAPPILFQVAGNTAPTASLERPSLVFILNEADHSHLVGLPPDVTPTFLRIDSGDLIEPYQVSVLHSEILHRTSELLFPLPSDVDPARLNREVHTFTILTQSGSADESVFTWALPLGLPGEAPSSPSLGASTPVSVSALSKQLTKVREGLAYGEKNGIAVQATYATPDYFRAAFPAEVASRYLPDRFMVFAVSEQLHIADLPSEALAVSVRLDGREYQADMSEPIAVSPHHRATLVRFAVTPPSGLGHHVLELRLPEGESLTWHLPISIVGAGSVSGFQLTWVSVLAVLAGMVAAMWPCLFQLTVFFIPALAGLSMQEASGSVAFGRRFQVVKAAFFFVLGFTIVYTVGGALIGFAAQRLGDSPDFYVWQRYAAIAGGVMIIILALRVAAKVRAPLVCRMPVLSKIAHGQKTANPIELMFAGLAFATGCMTCFGAAIVIAMVVYVGLAGSVAVGALTMFLFALGMGIPLVLAAMAMAKVLPMLFRLEKVIPWMGLASAILMTGFGVLLITGNYMVLTEWVFRALPLARVG